jgi:uncharacterized protein YqeY
MSIIQRIQQDIIVALKAKDAERLTALRLLQSALKNAEIEKKVELEDAEVISLLQRELKRRQESLRMYTEAGRSDLATTESREAAIIQEYLPEQLSDEELRAIVTEIRSALGADASFGDMMRAVMSRVAGQADGSRVSSLLKQT